MTEAHIKQMIEAWQRRLGLSQWRISVLFDDNPAVHGKSVFCACNRHEYFDMATFEFHSCVLTGDIETLGDVQEVNHIKAGTLDLEQYVEETIVHELLHLAARNMMEVSDLFRSHAGAPTLLVWDEAWHRAEEEFCERVSVALVQAVGETSIHKAAAQAERNYVERGTTRKRK